MDKISDFYKRPIGKFRNNFEWLIDEFRDPLPRQIKKIRFFLLQVIDKIFYYFKGTIDKIRYFFFQRRTGEIHNFSSEIIDEICDFFSPTKGWIWESFSQPID